MREMWLHWRHHHRADEIQRKCRYIIMEFMEAGSLSSTIKANGFGGLLEPMVAMYIIQVCPRHRDHACQGCSMTHASARIILP